MHFAFNEEQTQLRDMFRAALEREAPWDQLRAWSEALDFSTFGACVRHNAWAGIGTRDEHGGQGGGVLEQALLFEALGHQAAPSGALLAQVAALALARQAGVAPAEMAALIEGGTTAAFDTGAPLDAGRLRVQAEGPTLSGQVPYALRSATGHAGWLVLVPERSSGGDAGDAGDPADAGDAGDASDGAQAQALGLWRVQADAPGLTLTPQGMLDRTRAFVTLGLHQTPARRIGALAAAGLAAVNARLAVLLAAESLGLARRMLAMTVAYVAQRVQFGVPVGSFQAVKHEAAQVLVDLEAAHSGVYYAAWALDEGEADGPMHAWIAKAFTCEAAARTADRALMLHGAIGYTLEYDLQFFFKRAKLNVELLGSPRHYRERIAAALPLLPTPDSTR
jgi:alkylation response protein AidB-like acyl-CoA dehydrogenase